SLIATIAVVDGAEITVECNPDDVTPTLTATYAAAGVNRISLGVQSMVPEVLQRLGRRHDRDNVASAVDAIRSAGIPTFNLDLIYGTVGESDDDWRSTLDEVLALDAPHISAYALTVEAGTPLAERRADHPDDDLQADRYEIVDEALTSAGLAGYEISNWAKPGHECRHNGLYWSQGDYWGFGCAAHSHRAGRRWWNVRTPDRYIDLVNSGASTEAAGEELDEETRLFEGLELSLRTREGVPLDRLDGEALPGIVEQRGDRWVLTRRGRLMANEVSTHLIV
ncbi:MAG: radical SAM family heme chaperone HemW, partial [Ilumatobacteraceae bacterium]